MTTVTDTEGIVAETAVSNLAISGRPAEPEAFFFPNVLGDTSSLPTPVISTFDSTSYVADGIGSVTFDVLPSAWPPNLPPPAVLYHLVETFFASVPLASRLIHKPSFMIALRQLPTSLDFP